MSFFVVVVLSSVVLELDRVNVTAPFNLSTRLLAGALWLVTVPLVPEKLTFIPYLLARDVAADLDNPLKLGTKS